ncbi:LPS export ABC transporter periplasmic protein LptC [Candidatus Magnetomonas plexicatena]|uniref:LPS export ABC transporter periplasmic protein LptC n=1 Tax=Candidatus Magnetomonas plexicatena TaxID=2552947 RepID=UPI0011005175|nr:LPS export ABC transporter periplasmic protein LptC [Nitrospirales bacterium LBB_01]
MRNTIPIIVVIAATVIYIMLAMPENDLTKNVKIQPGDSVMEKVNIYRSTDTKIVWRAKVNRLILEDNRKAAKIDGIEADFPEKSITVKAKSGLYDFSNNTITVDSDMLAYNKDAQITSKDIYVDFKTQTVSSKSGVTITGKNYTVTADSFNSSNGDNVTLNGNVKVVYN